MLQNRACLDHVLEIRRLDSLEWKKQKERCFYFVQKLQWKPSEPSPSSHWRLQKPEYCKSALTDSFQTEKASCDCSGQSKQALLGWYLQPYGTQTSQSYSCPG